jgi:hypothetical protein
MNMTPCISVGVQEEYAYVLRAVEQPEQACKQQASSGVPFLVTAVATSCLTSCQQAQRPVRKQVPLVIKMVKNRCMYVADGHTVDTSTHFFKSIPRIKLLRLKLYSTYGNLFLYYMLR